MVCDMEVDQLNDDLEDETLVSMWPTDLTEDGRQFNVEKAQDDEDMLVVTIVKESSEADLQRLGELSNSEKGSSQLAYLMKQWEYSQGNAVRLLREESDSLYKQWHEVELRKLNILREQRFEEETCAGDKRHVSILNDLYEIYQPLSHGKDDAPVPCTRFDIDAENDTVQYWKKRALEAEERLDASMQREQILMEKLKENIKNMELQQPPVEELSQMLKRADNFLHFILQNAPIVVAHMDKELRYRFIYNHYPSFKEEDLIGKTETEIFSGAGVKESLDFKREVLERGLPGKREITFDTELFGAKTFLMYVEPVFNKSGETIGVNYIGMEITDQVRKREKMAKLREEIAVQKAMETELHKTIRITEETMRAKQMLATMSHEIRSPLSGVLGTAEILATTRLDHEQKQYLNVMMSSGDLVLQLVNDILDLSKVESGVMKLEATKFRPREVVKHVLQIASASLRKMLVLEGHIADDVPVEVIGDVLRIRQILTNLVSNSIKFTHEGKVGIKLYAVSGPDLEKTDLESVQACNSFDDKHTGGPNYGEDTRQNSTNYEEPMPLVEEGGVSKNEDGEKQSNTTETTVWIRCDVHDTGIGIPESALPKLFTKYMQVRADHARKYGGTGLGLAICKQLVELMGGCLSVTSKENCGSTFTFVLPYKVSSSSGEESDDPDELPDKCDTAGNDGTTCGYFQFQPRNVDSLRNQNLLLSTIEDSMRPEMNESSQATSATLPSSPGIAAATHGVMASNVNTSPSVHDRPRPSESLRKQQEGNTDDKFRARGGGAIDKGVDDGKSKVQNDISGVVPIREVAAGETSKISKSPEGGGGGQLQISKRNAGSSSSSSSNNLEATETECKPKILLVEDNKINVMLTKNMMKQLGHIIDVVYNGVEAVRAVQRQSYSLIFMDVCMPVMDGLEATRIIRSYEDTGKWDAAVEAGICESVDSLSVTLPPTTRIPIIAMTANALSESSEECYANGMDSFVSKPVTFQKLRSCLEQYLP